MTEKEIQDLAPVLRKNVIELILLIGSEKEQLKYAETVGDGVAADELVCMWFDDMYQPDSPAFNTAFNNTELVLLSSFNHFFDSVFKSLPDTVSEMLKTTEWQNVIFQANECYNKINSTQHNL